MYKICPLTQSKCLGEECYGYGFKIIKHECKIFKYQHDIDYACSPLEIEYHLKTKTRNHHSQTYPDHVIKYMFDSSGKNS